jgi:hypothetical protein
MMAAKESVSKKIKFLKSAPVMIRIKIGKQSTVRTRN